MAEDNVSKPGQAALENMKLLKTECNVFKVPRVPKQKTAPKKTHVLDEDDYVEKIEKIIQRDFFPDLEKLNAQNEFLEATENKDYAKLMEITRKYSGRRPPTEPYNSPATFDTPTADRPGSPSMPDHQIRSDQSTTAEKPKDVIDHHTLDSFLAAHTSEDNASYDRVIALEDRKRANKLSIATMYEAEKTSAVLAIKHVELPSIEAQADQSERPDEIQTWPYRAKNYIMYVPDGGGDVRPVKPELVHGNTRLRADPFDQQKNKETIEAIAKTQEASVTGKIGVDGVSVTTDKEEYPFVATPSPRPGGGPDASPLMTWGEIEGTPFRLDGGDTPTPAKGAGAAYRMLEAGARERIALQLAEQAARRRRPSTPRVAPSTPSFRTNSERLASMSPAARKLAAKHLMSPRQKLTPHMMGIFTHMATPKRTPTPNRRLVTPKTPNSKKIGTPSLTGSVNNSDNMIENNNLTDNLLQINVAKRSRLKAQDFFK